MKGFFTIITVLVNFMAIGQAGTYTICPVDPLGPAMCGCCDGCAAAGQCTPESPGVCTRQSTSATYSIPPDTDAQVLITGNMCDEPLDGPGLEYADDITINGIVVYDSPNSSFGGEFPNLDLCYRNNSTTNQDIELTFSSNRKDECIEVEIVFFSEGSLSGCELLPVELVYFNAKVIENNDVQLTWKTLTEVNNLGFEIQKSLDGSHFIELFHVDGNGSSSDPHKYEHVIHNLQSGVHYFRLRQIDFDGTFAYSKMIVVQVGSKAVFSIAQTVNSNKYMVENLGDHAIASISIFSGNGKNIYHIKNVQLPPGKNYFELPLETGGVYFVQISSEFGVVNSKIVKY